MAMNKKEPVVHYDKLGQLISIGDLVAYVNTTGYSSAKGTLAIGKIIDFTPKNVRISRNSVGTSTILRYPTEVLIMQDENIKRIMLAKMKGIKSVKNI
jgi:hypothetical protein